MRYKYHTLDITESSFLVTGGAGFIGSNLVEYLLEFGAKHVRVLDNLSTGNIDNIEAFKKNARFEFIEGDIRNLETCISSCENIDYIFHEAALGSVPRSISDPLTTNNVNITGFLNMLIAVKESGVKRMVYAASSSTYGDSKALPKVENVIGKPMSPYAVTKYVNELYANVFSRIYGIELVGLRYFNVYGRKQNPNGAYAAVIPKFINLLIDHESPVVNGDGEYSRDFTYIDNVIQANMLACETKIDLDDAVFNVACGERTSLNEMIGHIKEILSEYDPLVANTETIYGSVRAGDVPHSLASLEKSEKVLNYKPKYNFQQGIAETIKWYWENRVNEHNKSR